MELRYYDTYNKILYITKDDGTKFSVRLNTTKEKMKHISDVLNIKFIDISKMEYENRIKFIENDIYKKCYLI